MRTRAPFVLALALVSIGCSSDYPWAAPAGSNGRGTARAAARPTLVGAEDATTGGDGSATSAAGATTTAGSAGASATGGASTTGGASAPNGDCTPNRSVLTSEMTNARDLGGTPLANGATVACGAIFRGPPLRLSAEGCSAAAQLGLRTLVDLRIEGERNATPDADCVDATRVFAPLPVPYGLAPADYLNDLHETASIAVAFRAFGDPAAYPIYFHCTFGRDRTGVLGALVLLALGASRSTVMQEYLLSQPNVGAYPDSLNAVLDEIEQRGGAANVLRDAGITDAELAVLRKSAIATD